MSKEYVFREEGCDRCSTEKVEVIEYENNKHFPSTVEVEHLCCFCYETHLGIILDYPRQYPNQDALARGLIQALHIIMKKVTK